MATIFTLLLIFAGLLACSNLILAKMPDSKKLFDKVAPYSGFVGVVLLVYGLFYAIKYVLPYFGTMLQSLAGWLAIAAVVDAVLLGFLLGYALIAKWVGDKSPEALAKGEKFRAKLAMAQIPLGIAGVALGIERVL